jgi:predicted esterase
MPQLLLLTRNLPNANNWNFVGCTIHWIFARSTVTQASPAVNVWRWTRRFWRWTGQRRWTQMKISTLKLAALRKVTAD